MDIASLLSILHRGCFEMMIDRNVEMKVVVKLVLEVAEKAF